jgi:RND family efflux transporter MFP subunit
VKAANIKFSFGLDTDEGFPRQGLLDFSENRVNAGTGTIAVRGVAENSDGLLDPGARVRVRLPLGESYKALLVPDSAVNTDQDKKFLLVVGPDNIVQRRDVRLGRLQDDGMRVIAAGLKPGERVIVDGTQRARPLYPVEPIPQTASPATQP